MSDTLFWSPDFTQVHKFDFFASSALTTTGAGEGHRTFRTAVKVVIWMIQLFRRKKGAIFRVIQIESDWTEIMGSRT